MSHSEIKHAKSAWISRSKKETIKKPWGYEYSWSGFNGIHGKTLFIQKGKRTSLKYNKMKKEVLMVCKGLISVEYGDELTLTDPVGHPMKKDVLESGDSLLVQSCSPYRFEALEDSEIIEIGDNFSDKPVRIEDDYGRVDNDAKD